MEFKTIRVPCLDMAGNPTGDFIMRVITQEEFEKREKAMPNMKVCLRCKESYPEMDFGRDKRQTDGLNRYCKPCHRGNCAKSRKKRSKPCVYQLFFTDGSTYIGSTVQNFSDRLAVHKAKIAKKNHTNKYFNGYEPEDCTGKVLLYVEDEEELRRHEYVMIKHYMEVYGHRCLNAYLYTGIKIENKGQENENQSELAVEGR
jgi:predicted GIY-YIG superfamily endonuclease